MAQARLGFAPKTGAMGVFGFKRGDRVKVLFCAGSGIVMICERLEQGGFALGPRPAMGSCDCNRVQFEALFAG